MMATENRATDAPQSAASSAVVTVRWMRVSSVMTATAGRRRRTNGCLNARCGDNIPGLKPSNAMMATKTQPTRA